MLYDTIKQDKILAMKSGNTTLKSVITIFQGEITTLSKKVNKEIDDEMCISVFQKMKKSLAEMLNYENSDKNKIEQEIEIISKYLPKMLNQKEIFDLIDENSIITMKDAFSFFSKSYKGQYDSKVISEYFKK